MVLRLLISLTKCSQVITASYIGTGTGEATFQNVDKFTTAINSFISTFQAIQSWNQSLRVEFEETNIGEDVKVSTSLTSKLPFVSDMLYFAGIHDLQNYGTSRRKVFGPQSFLRRYIDLMSSSSIYSERRSHFAVLWIINKMLYDLRHDYHESKEFIERLLHDVVSGEIPMADGDHAAERAGPDGIATSPSL